MKELLSAEELSQLLTAVTEGQAPAASPPVVPRERAIQSLDFRQPARLSRDQLRAVRQLYDAAAVALSSAWSDVLHAPVEAAVTSADVVSFGTLCAGLPGRVCIQTFRVGLGGPAAAPTDGRRREPSESRGLVALDIPLALGIVERLLGGRGQAIEQPRPLTAIEQAVIAAPLRTALQCFAAAWAPVASVVLQPLAFEMSPRTAQVLAVQEAALQVVFALGGEACVGDVSLCLPLEVVERLIPRGSPGLASLVGAAEPPPASVEALRRAVGAAPVRVAAELGQAHISILDLIGLEPSHVVRLDSSLDDPLVVTVERKPHLTARPGLRGSRLAVQILDQPLPPRKGAAQP